MKLFKRLFCLHNWKRFECGDYLIFAYYDAFKGEYMAYKCQKCGKVNGFFSQSIVLPIDTK